MLALLPEHLLEVGGRATESPIEVEYLRSAPLLVVGLGHALNGGDRRTRVIGQVGHLSGGGIQRCPIEYLFAETGKGEELPTVLLGGVVELAHTHGAADRSEERRVGKECRSRWSPCQ